MNQFILVEYEVKKEVPNYQRGLVPHGERGANLIYQGIDPSFGSGYAMSNEHNKEEDFAPILYLRYKCLIDFNEVTSMSDLTQRGEGFNYDNNRALDIHLSGSVMTLNYIPAELADEIMNRWMKWKEAMPNQILRWIEKTEEVVFEEGESKP